MKSRLFLIDPDVVLSNLLTEKQRTPGTCEWIIDDTRYQEWINSPSNSLWLIGGPGKGKTMIAMHVVDSLRNMPSVHSGQDIVLFFFCSDRYEHQNNAKAVLRGLLYQLIKRRTHLERYCDGKLDKENQAQTLSSFGALWQIFVDMLGDMDLGDVFIVLDGVEECDEASRTTLLPHFFDWLSTRRSTSRNSVKLFGASREILGAHFRPDCKIELGFVGSSLTDQDVEMFVDQRLERLARVDGFHRIRDLVRKSLLDRSEGTFLVVALLVQQLEAMDTAFEMEEVLDTMPTGLDSLYNQMLSRLDPKTKQVLQQSLRWMLVARRPLTLSELAAVIERPKRATFTPEEVLSGFVRKSQGFLQSIPGHHALYTPFPRVSNLHMYPRDPPKKHLVVALYNDEKSKEALRKRITRRSLDPTKYDHEYVQYRSAFADGDVFIVFYHQSMREFFLDTVQHLNPHMSELRFRESGLQTEAARNAMQYIAASMLSERWICLNLPEVKKAYPFLLYASTNWVYHALRSEGAGKELLNIPTVFLETSPRGSALRVNWLLSYLLEVSDGRFILEYGAGRNDLPLLHMATWFGLASWIADLVPATMPAHNRRRLMNTPDSTKKLPLDFAVEENNIDLARTLLQHGAEPTHRSYVVAFHPQKEALLTLLIHHGNVDAPTNFDILGPVLGKYITLTPLVQAMSARNWRVALLLIDGGADVQSRISDYLFHATCHATHPDVLRRLLVHNIELQDLLESALSVAAIDHDNADVSLRVLLDHELMDSALQHVPNIDPDTNRRFSRILRRAAACGHSNSVSHLLSHRVDCNIPDENGKTAALLALGSGHQDLVVELLKKGAVLGDLDRLGGDILCRAAASNNIDGVKMLLHNGVDVNSLGDEGINALMQASAMGHTQMVIFLLNNGAALDMEDGQRRTALHHAAQEGQKAVTTILLKEGALPNTTDMEGETALHYAAKSGHVEVLTLLVQKKGDGKLRNEAGMNAWDLLKKFKKDLLREISEPQDTFATWMDG